jgi:hypothetical protein
MRALSSVVIQIHDQGPGKTNQRLENIFLPSHMIPTINVIQQGVQDDASCSPEHTLRIYGGSVGATNVPDDGHIVNFEESSTE